METQINTIFSHGKVSLGKQALATDRRLSGVKKGHFSKILQERKRSNIGGWRDNKRRARAISWGGQGGWVWNTIQKPLPVYTPHPFRPCTPSFKNIAHWSSN